MRHLHLILTVIFILSLAPAYSADQGDFKFKKQPELQHIKPPKPVKIKLKRTAKDEYSWELSGDDADQIVKTDRRLRKMLNIK